MVQFFEAKREIFRTILGQLQKDFRPFFSGFSRNA